MEESENYNRGSLNTDETWQCWMVNTITGEEALIAYGFWSELECESEASRIFAQWNTDLYPSTEGWTVVYRQDSPLKMAQYWRNYYQERANFWSQQYDKLLQEYNQSYSPVQALEPSQPTPLAKPKKLKRIRRVATRPTTGVESQDKGLFKILGWVGKLFSGILFFAIAPEVLALLTESSKKPHYSTQHMTDIPLSIRELFSSQTAPGAIAVGVAEGNLTPSGKPTAIYLRGHTDPGNFATNRGFCSWNKANGISIAEADRRCLEALQWHSVAIENQLLHLELNPENHKTAITMGTDLWNQSNSAGPNFPFKYKAAKDQGFDGQQAYIWARVEAFRNKQQELDASGLFGICRREPYYRQQLVGLVVDSEEWRWNCIKLDQRRRVLEIEKVFESEA